MKMGPYAVEKLPAPQVSLARAVKATRLRLIVLLFACASAPVAVAGASEASRVPLRVSAQGDGALSTADGRIDCGTKCVARYRRGRVVTLRQSAGADFYFDGWSAGCVGRTTTCTVLVDRATEVGAIFTRIATSVELSVGGPGNVASDPPGISCGSQSDDCEGEFGQGQTIGLTPSPDPGAEFAGWVGPCRSAGASPCTITLGPAGGYPFAANDTVATFRSMRVTGGPTTVSSNGQQVTSSPAGIDCPPTCSATFAPQTRVTLFGFGWQGACVGVLSFCTLVPDGRLDVVLRPPPPLRSDSGPPPRAEVGVSVSGRGRVSGGKYIRCGRAERKLTKCDASVPFDRTVVLKARPAARFAGWRGSCSGRRPTCRLHAVGALTVHAIFASGG
jgi:hypothetical protein